MVTEVRIAVPLGCRVGSDGLGRAWERLLDVGGHLHLAPGAASELQTCADVP